MTDMTVSSDVKERMQHITVLGLDVDGVLTDGRIVYNSWGMETKAFDVQDGAGIRMWHRAGHRSFIITGRQSSLVRRRAKELGVTCVRQRALEKLPAFEDVLQVLGVTPDQICYIGDDLMELPLLRRVGLAVAVPHAVSDVRAAAHQITTRSGGRGAVREVIDHILQVQGRWDDVIQRYAV